MSDKHVVAALQRSVADLELRLREVVRERDEARAFSAELESNVRRLARERDEARAARDHFKQQLRERAEALLDARAEIERFRNAVREKERLELAAVQELDEARAEVERLREGIECHIARPGEGTYECGVNRKCQACRLRHAESEVERLEHLFQQTHGVHHSWVDARHKVAERQREACAEAVKRFWGVGDHNAEVQACRATPLVTEGKP